MRIATVAPCGAGVSWTVKSTSTGSAKPGAQRPGFVDQRQG